MEKGWTYLEKDFSDEDLIDQPFDTGIDEFIYTMLSKHFKNSTYMVDMQYLRKYKTIIENSYKLAQDCHGVIQVRLNDIPLNCEVRISADNIEYDNYSPELKKILDECNGLSISIDSKGKHIIIIIDIPIFLKI
jgi:hypothetical protein